MRKQRLAISGAAGRHARYSRSGRDLRADPPLRPPAAENSDVIPTADRQPPGWDSHLPRVLVVDDEDEIAIGAARRLQAAGFNTFMAKEGITGIKCAHDLHPDLILLDMRMPTWDGLQVLSELQAADDTRHIPVVMLSASLADRQRSLQAGARLFLSKPYDGMVLIDAVQQVIQESLSGKSA